MFEILVVIGLVIAYNVITQVKAKGVLNNLAKHRLNKSADTDPQPAYTTAEIDRADKKIAREIKWYGIRRSMSVRVRYIIGTAVLMGIAGVAGFWYMGWGVSANLGTTAVTPSTAFASGLSLWKTIHDMLWEFTIYKYHVPIMYWLVGGIVLTGIVFGGLYASQKSVIRKWYNPRAWRKTWLFVTILEIVALIAGFAVMYGVSSEWQFCEILDKTKNPAVIDCIDAKVEGEFANVIKFDTYHNGTDKGMLITTYESGGLGKWGTAQSRRYNRANDAPEMSQKIKFIIAQKDADGEKDNKYIGLLVGPTDQKQKRNKQVDFYLIKK